MNRKYLLFFLLLLALLTLLACTNNGKSTLPINENYDLNYDNQYLFEKPMASLPSMAESNDGYYFFSGPNNQFLYYLDKKSLKPVILCNKPDCLHTDESDPSKIANCNAFFQNPGSMIHYDSYLYIFDFYGTYLYQVSLDGTRKRTVYQFKNVVEFTAIHRGYLYCSVNDYGTEKGRTGSSKTDCKLLKIDLSNTSKEPEVLYEFSGIDADIRDITGLGDAVYFRLSAYTDSTLQKSSKILKQYNIQDGSIREIGKDIGRITINGNKLVYTWNKQAYGCNLDGSGRKPLKCIKGYMYSDENYILEDTKYLKDQNGQKVKRQLNVYDLEGNPINSIDLSGLVTQLTYGGDSNYLFIPDSSSENEFEPIHTLWAIDKSKLSIPGTKPFKIFEFVPKVKG